MALSELAKRRIAEQPIGIDETHIEWVSYWNDVISGVADLREEGKSDTEIHKIFLHLYRELNADVLWEEFGIKSWPRFRDACAWSIPNTWSETVREFIVEAKEKYPEVVLHQIKEKWCQLTVYYEPISVDFNWLIEYYRQKLVDAGYHPPTRFTGGV